MFIRNTILRHSKKFRNTSKSKIILSHLYGIPSKSYFLSSMSYSIFKSQADPLALGRSELIQAICSCHQEDSCVIDGKFGHSMHSWSSTFIKAAHILESGMLLHNHKGAKNLMHKFKSIDPDRYIAKEVIESNDTDNCEEEDLEKEAVKPVSCVEEMLFMTQFAYVLKKAGYHEIPQDVVKQCLKDHHKYGMIELDVNIQHYLFVRFWVYGSKKVDATQTFKSYLKTLRGNEMDNQIHVHERVLVAARGKRSNNMILKGFKDVHVDHYETLLPEAKIRIPRARRWFLNTSLTMTGIVAFVNIGMTLLTDLKMDSTWIIVFFGGLLSYRTFRMYKVQHDKYMLAWKKMLYYKSTSNNAGLVLETINKAHERSVKEALLVYGTALRLTKNRESVSEGEVTSEATAWLSSALGQSDVSTLDLSSSYGLLQNNGLLLRVASGENMTSQFVVCPPTVASELLLQKVKNLATS